LNELFAGKCVKVDIIISAGKKYDDPQRSRLWVVGREGLGVTKNKK